MKDSSSISHPGKKFYLGVDLGGTNIRVGIRESGTSLLLDQEWNESSTQWDSLQFIESIDSLFKKIQARHPEISDHVAGMGVGLPGDINYHDGTCHSMSKFPKLNSLPLASYLTKHFGCPAYILNDGLVTTLAELRAGAGRNSPDFVMITLGTGIGGGVVVGRKLLLGEHARIGKVAHHIIDMNGPQDNHCGLKGCWEAFAGKHAIEQRARDLMLAHPNSALARLDPKKPSLKEAIKLSRQDEASQELFVQTGRYVGIGLANLIKILAPSAVIIGGGLSQQNEVLFEAISKTLQTLAVKPYQVVPVLPAQLGYYAGLIGATFLAEGNAA